MSRQNCFLALFLIFFVAPLRAMIDNRFFVPYLFDNVIYVRHDDSPTKLIVEPFAMTASHSFGDDEHDNAALFDGVYGRYNEREEDRALIASGRTDKSLFRSDLLGYLGPIPWFMNGRMEAYGIALNWYEAICPWFGFGIVGAFMHVSSRMAMKRDTQSTSQNLIFGPGDEIELLLTKERINKALGVTPPLWNSDGITDLDVFIRFAKVVNYRYKFRRLEFGLKLGCIVPTAEQQNINDPASIPFGGNRQWGFYIDGALDAVLKEDMSAGFFMRLSKRLTKTIPARMPILTEPTNYGAIVGTAAVTPGVTFAFSPYLTFERVRDGLGFRLQYTLVVHERDDWNIQCTQQHHEPNISLLERRSCWGLEHVTVGAMYDFAVDRECHGPTPVVSLIWDIPVQGFVSAHSFKTNGIALIIESDF